MKLATLKNGERDGALCIVSRDLQQALLVCDIAPTLQNAIERSREIFPKLEKIYEQLNRRELPNAFPFDPAQAMAPLPRAYQWIDGSAYLHHVELVRKARGARLPAKLLKDPLFYQGVSDNFLGACDSVFICEETDGADFESEIAVITDDVSLGASVEECKNKILLFTLVNDVTLRNLIPDELAKGFGFFHSKPPSSFSPVAITPDELGNAWDGERVHLPLSTYFNHQLFGKPDAGEGMHFSFPELIMHAARRRPLGAGTILGSGTISNDDPAAGSSCLAERRMLEIIADGKAHTPYMKKGDHVRIEMLNAAQENLFGSIDQSIQLYSF